MLNENNITLSAEQVSAIPMALKGATNGVAELDANGKILSSQLPSYVDEVLEFSNLENFPSTGEAAKIYVDLLTNQIYNAFDDEGNNDIRAVGGTILQYWSKVIIQLERGDEVNKRVATLVRHRSIPEGNQAVFSITSRGIV